MTVGKLKPIRLSKPRESSIEMRACREIKRLWPQVETRKLNGAGNRDWPDRLFLFPNGRHLMIEFKRPGEKLRPSQEHRINTLRLLGHLVAVCYNVETAVYACKEANK